MEDLIKRVIALDYYDNEVKHRELDAEIAWTTKWRWDGWDEDDIKIEERPLDYVVSRVQRGFNSVWNHIPRYTSSIDDAMLLRGEFPWLLPIIQFHDQTVTLVNGLGLPVNGNDFKTRANLVPCAITAAWLKVISEKSNG